MIFRNIGQLRQPEALFGGVRTIAVREAVRVARRAPPRPADIDLMTLPAPGDAQVATDVRVLLQGLSPEHRAVLVLRHLAGLDETATSELLAIPAGTVKSRLSRARDGFVRAWSR